MSEEDEKPKRRSKYDEPTSIGAGIAWGSLWVALGIYFAAAEIAQVL